MEISWSPGWTNRDSFTWDGITPYTSAGAQVGKQLWKRTRSRSWWTRRVQNILMANSPTLNCINQKIEGRHNSLVSATYELALEVTITHFVMWSTSGVINSTEHIVYEEKMTPSCVVSYLQRTCKAWEVGPCESLEIQQGQVQDMHTSQGKHLYQWVMNGFHKAPEKDLGILVN